MHTPCYIPGIQCIWKDGKIKRLENLLNDLIIELCRISEEHVKEQARQKQQEIERIEQQKRAMERERQLTEERRKIELLLSAAEHWKEAMHLQEFCKSLESACLTETLTIEQKTSAEEMIALLNGYSQLINPLTSIEKLLEKFKSGYKWMYQRHW